MVIGDGSEYTMLNYLKIEANTGTNNIPYEINKAVNIIAYPNPTNNIVNFEYNIIERSNVSLCIFDLSGRKVETIVNDFQDKNNYKIAFNTEKLNSGIFIYTLQTDKLVISKKLIVK